MTERFRRGQMVRISHPSYDLTSGMILGLKRLSRYDRNHGRVWRVMVAEGTRDFHEDWLSPADALDQRAEEAEL